MKLNQEGIELIRKVRDRMEKSQGTGLGANSFICWNLVFVASDYPVIDRKSLPERIEELGGVCEEIWLAIRDALEGTGMMETYIYQQFAKAGTSITTGAAYDYAKLARMAWLDRIIETGVIE